MVDVDKEEFEMVDDPQQTNYYAPIQYDNTSDNEQNNESDNRNDENNNLHKEARVSNEETTQEEIPLYNDNNILTPLVEAALADAHLSNNTDESIPTNTENKIPHNPIAGKPALSNTIGAQS